MYVTAEHIETIVLILVLMEDGLRVGRTNDGSSDLCCVLILVLMEDGLRDIKY